MKDSTHKKITPFIIWLPILKSDSEPPTPSALGRLRDARAAQFWDPDQRLALDLKRKLAADPQHPQPKCCDTDKVPWDVILIYRPGVTWEQDLPRASYANGPVYKLEQQIRKALTQ